MSIILFLLSYVSIWFGLDTAAVAAGADDAVVCIGGTVLLFDEYVLYGELSIIIIDASLVFLKLNYSDYEWINENGLRFDWETKWSPFYSLDNSLVGVIIFIYCFVCVCVFVCFF